MVQRLGFWALTAHGLGSILGQGTKIPQATWCCQNKSLINSFTTGFQFPRKMEGSPGKRNLWLPVIHTLVRINKLSKWQVMEIYQKKKNFQVPRPGCGYTLLFRSLDVASFWPLTLQPYKVGTILTPNSKGENQVTGSAAHPRLQSQDWHPDTQATRVHGPPTGFLGLFKTDTWAAILGILAIDQLLSCVWFFVTPWIAAHQAFLSFTISRSFLKFMSTESVMLSNHLILCCPLLWPSVFPSI